MQVIFVKDQRTCFPRIQVQKKQRFYLLVCTLSAFSSTFGLVSLLVGLSKGSTWQTGSPPLLCHTWLWNTIWDTLSLTENVVTWLHVTSHVFCTIGWNQWFSTQDSFSLKMSLVVTIKLMGMLVVYESGMLLDFPMMDKMAAMTRIL